MAFKLIPDEPKQSPNSLSQESLHRIPTQAAKGIVSQGIGLPGDLLSFLNDYAAGPLAEKITGEKSVPYEDTPIGKLIPTSSTHKKNLEEGIPYLKPKNKIENFVSNVAEDATALFAPSSALKKIGLRGSSALKSFATALGANSAGDLVADFSGDEKKGAYTKMGFMFLGSLLNKPTVQKEITRLYKKADDLLPSNATVNATRLQRDMHNLQNRVLNGRQVRDLAPSEKFVVDEADTILRQINGGQANVGTLRSSLRSLNENLQRAVYEAPDKSTRVRAKKLASQINKDVNSTLADYGSTNPEWWKAQKSANEAFGTVQQSHFITRFIEKHAKSGTATHGLLHALGIGLDVGTGVIPYQAAKIIYRISNSEELAKHYTRIVASATAENASQMNKEIKELDEKLKKDELKRKSSFKLLD